MKRNTVGIIYTVLGVLNAGYFVFENMYRYNLQIKSTAIFAILAIFFFVNAGFCLFKNKEEKYQFPKVYRIAAILLLIIITPIFIFILTPKTDSMDIEADYIIVLGGDVRKKYKPSASTYRLEKAADYLYMHPKTKCVISGCPFYYTFFTDDKFNNRGINKKDFIIDWKSGNTIENFYYSKNCIKEKINLTEEEVLNKEIVIITSYFHLHRAELIAKKAGFTRVHGIACHIPWYDAPLCYIREIGSCMKLLMQNCIK